MLFHPAIIALLTTSMLTSLMLLYAGYYGYLIIRQWDLSSGSELQLSLERRTYLISTILTYLFAFQVLSLFLYLYTADSLHTFFVGAMCAAGTLNVNGYGYPALVLKIVNLLTAGVWLILNFVDNRAYDYPLVRKKYLFLLVITPLLLIETVTLAGYFLGLDPNIITSCCGSLFSEGGRSISSDIVSLPPGLMGMAFYVSMAGSVALGLAFFVKEKGAYLFSAMAGIAFVVAVLATISYISPYIYELPTHHCPFCILQGEYGYIGYPLYAGLLGGAVTGLGVGVLMPFRNMRSLRTIIPGVQKRLTIASVICYVAFAAIVTYRIMLSNLVLQP
jgi:hypothetical protein